MDTWGRMSWQMKECVQRPCGRDELGVFKKARAAEQTEKEQGTDSQGSREKMAAQRGEAVSPVLPS